MRHPVSGSIRNSVVPQELWMLPWKGLGRCTGFWSRRNQLRTELGPQGQNPLDSARHMSHLPAVYLLNDNEDTELSGILEDSRPWQRDQFSSWDLRRTCLSRASLVSLSNSKPIITCHPSQACNQWLLGETRVPLIHFENGS